MRSATFGLRLCGIADEPFMPGGERLLDLAHLRAREMADLGREAVERRRAQRERRQQLGMAVARDHLRRRPDRAPARAARTRCARPRDRSPRTCRRCPDSWPTRHASSARSSRVRARSSSNAQPASFQPNVVGSAWMPCERPMQIVCAVLLGAPHDGGERAVDARRAIERARVAHLQRERGVDDVRRGEPVVHPAALGPELLGDARRRTPRGRGRSSARSRRRARASARRRARGSLRRPRRARRRARPSRRAPPARPRASARACPPPTRSGSSPGGSSGRSLGQCRAASGGHSADGCRDRRVRRRGTRSSESRSTHSTAACAPSPTGP